jgi:aminoglycoside 2'-N-acetyltransferase I
MLRLFALAIRAARTDELNLPELRSLLDEAFVGEFADSDWEHALGGTHALAYEDDSLVGHGSVVPRTLTFDGRPLRVGYVEGMAVQQTHRRRGHGAAIMDALEAVIRRDYELGALSATDEGAALYAARGWVNWSGPTVPDAVRSIYVLPLSSGVDVSGELACDWREGDLW